MKVSGGGKAPFELIRAAARATVSRYENAVTPIYARKHGAFKLVGTGILIDLNDLYLLAAAHVLETRSSYTLYIGFRNAVFSFVGPHRTVAASDGSSTKRLDFAAYRIPEEDIKHLAGSRPIQLEDVTVNPVTRIDRDYMLYGFPSSRNKKLFLSKPGGFQKNPAILVTNGKVPDKELSRKLMISPMQHMCFNINGPLVGGDGKDIRLSAMNGMSGGPVFAFVEGIKYRGSRAVGVPIAMFIEHHKKEQLGIAVQLKLIVATLLAQFDRESEAANQ